MRSTKHPTVHFLFFYHSCSKDGEGAAGKGNDGGRQTHPTRRTRAQYKKNFADCLFFFFQCRGAATGVAGAVKVAARGHAERTSRPPFPKLPPKKKKNFFLLLFMGTPSDPSTTPTKSQQCPSQLKKKRELLFPAHISHFTVPERLQKCSSLPFFFYLSSQILL